MDKLKTILTSFCVVGALTVNSVEAQSTYSVWFDKPINLTQNTPAWASVNAKDHEENKLWEVYTLPIGNGSIGANIFGNIKEERITFNEKTLWSGGPNVGSSSEYYWNVNKNSAKYLPEIREAFTVGNTDKAADLTRNHFNGLASYEPSDEKEFRFGAFSTMGEFRVQTELDGSKVSNYKRSLSLDSAMVSVEMSSKGATYYRDYFCSYPDNVFVARYSSNQSNNQTLRFYYLAPSNTVGKFKVIGDNHLQYVGMLKDNQQQFAIDILCETVGGTLKLINDEFVVDSASDVVFKVVASTDYYMNFDPDFTDAKTYVGEYATIKNAEQVAKIKSKNYSDLLNAHIADYSPKFNRVDLNINDSKSYEQLPTDVRLAQYKKGASDYYLETLYFQFGRYLLLASSREGSMPANLQGIWNNNIDGPWHVDYHNNINIQMNYWPVSIANLNECARPLFDYIRTLVKPGRITAQSYFGARGWTASISANIYGFTAPLTSHDMSWNFNPMAGPWLATHVWDYYDYTRDKEFLKENYDLISESADFVVDYLWKRPNGSYTATPSTSPEHGPIDEGATFVHAVAKEILLDAIRANEILGYDKKQKAEWKEVLENIYPYKIGRYGQLQEWYNDIDDPKSNHRHVNHLYGLHPGRTISPITTPELATASRVVLEHRGDFATGWSMGWKLNQWARLHDGDHSYKLYQNLLREGTVANLWDTHPPFQIDGNFGGTAGVAEMLLQSHMGFVHILPALPSAWSVGSVKGLMARGNFEVDLSWVGGKLSTIDILSKSGEPCLLHYDGQDIDFKTKKGTRYHFKLVNGKLKRVK